MKIYYTFGDDHYEYEPSDDLLEKAKIDILEEQDKEDLIEIIIAEDNIEDCFYDQLKDYFEEYAYDEYKDVMALQEPPYRQSDFIWKEIKNEHKTRI